MKNAIIILVISYLGIIGNSGLAAQNLDSLYALWQDPTQPDSTRSKAYKDYIWKGFLFSNPDTAALLADELIYFGAEQPYPNAQGLGLNTKGVSYAVRGDYPKALDYYNQSLKISEQLGDLKGIANALFNIGNIYMEQGDYPKALDYYTQSLKIEEQLGDQKGKASALGTIGLIYFNQSDYPKALDYYNQSLKIEEQLGHQMGIVTMLNNIGLIYDYQGDYPKALEYYKQCLKNFEQLDNQKGIANVLGNIGVIYSNQGDYPKALDYYTQSLTIVEKLGDQKVIANSLNNIGNIFQDQGNYPKALDYYTQSLNIREQLGDQQGITVSLFNIGNIYKDQGDYPKALVYCHKGYTLAVSIGLLHEQQSACQCLYKTYKITGKSTLALEYFEKMNVLKDSIYNEENTRKLTRLEMQYDFDKKEAAALAEQEKKDAIALQEIKRQKLVRNGFMGGFAAMLLFGGVVFVQRNRISKEKDRSESLLLNILPAETAQELKEKGSSDAVLINQVTVLFTDFKGFTAMSEILSPKELVADLHDCFSEFDRICEKHGIEKIKTIGDAYMAAGGLPSPNSTHAEDVVKAGLKMAAFVEAGKANKIKQGLPFFEIRIGVHTGPVVAGIVGIKKFSYDIWGDTVNTASRMESSGEVGKVNVSESTYKLVKDEFNCEFRGKVAAKGKGEIEMYFVSTTQNKQNEKPNFS